MSIRRTRRLRCGAARAGSRTALLLRPPPVRDFYYYHTTAHLYSFPARYTLPPRSYTHTQFFTFLPAAALPTPPERKEAVPPARAWCLHHLQLPAATASPQQTSQAGLGTTRPVVPRPRRDAQHCMAAPKSMAAPTRAWAPGQRRGGHAAEEERTKQAASGRWGCHHSKGTSGAISLHHLPPPPCHRHVHALSRHCAWNCLQA